MDKTLSLADRTASELTQYILDHNLEPGMKIPAEKDLCVLLGTGRNTVREAVRQLAAQNVLEVRRGDGTYISERRGVSDDPFGLLFVTDKAKTSEDLMRIRMMIEPTAAGLAAENAEDGDLPALREACAACEEQIRSGADYTEADTAFHTQIAVCSKNIILPKLLPIIARGIDVYSRRDVRLREQTALLHRRILNAVEAHRALEAEEAMAYHLEMVRNKPVDLVNS